LLGLAIKRLYKIKKNPIPLLRKNLIFRLKKFKYLLKKNGRLYGWWIPSTTGAPGITLVHGWGRNLSFCKLTKFKSNFNHSNPERGVHNFLLKYMAKDDLDVHRITSGLPFCFMCNSKYIAGVDQVYQ